MTDQVLLADQRVANRHDSLRADRLQVRFHRPRTLGLIARQQRTVAWAPGVHQHVGEQPRADQLTQHADVITAGKSVGLSGLGHHIAYVDPPGLAAPHGVGHAAHQQVRNHTRIEAAWSQHNQLRVLNGRRTSGSVATSAGFKPTRRMRLRARGICDSPSTMVPSVNSAHNTTSWAADGSTRPRMFSTLLVSFTALSRSPVTPARLAMNRLPNAWPSSAPPWKRYSNSWVISGSDSASATRQSRMSPGGRMPSSRRSRPELPPSSNTVTTAVRLLVNSFNPRSSVERPVPPPMTTMRGPRRRWRCWARTSTSWCWPGGRRAPAMARTVPCRPANTASNPPPMNTTPSQLGDSAPRLQVSTATARRNIENSIQPSGRTLTMSRTPADSNTMPAAINTTQRFTPSPGASHWARRRSLVGTGLLLPDVAMPDRDAVTPAGKVVGQCIRQHHRTVFATRAPERHRQVALALFHILRQQIVHQLGQVAHELLRRGGVEHKVADLRAVAGQGAQRLVVVRVGQEPHVEHEVGVERNAIFVPKREHGDGEWDRVRTASERAPCVDA